MIESGPKSPNMLSNKEAENDDTKYYQSLP